MATVPFGVRDKRTFQFVITPLYVLRAIGRTVNVHGKDQPVTHDIIPVYVAILSHKNRTTNQCNPSMDLIAKELHMGKRIIVQCVRWLRDLKMLETKPCVLPSGRTGHQYDFIDPPDVRFQGGTDEPFCGSMGVDFSVPMRNLNQSSQSPLREPDFATRTGWGMGTRDKAWKVWMDEHGKPPPSDGHLRDWWGARAERGQP